MGINAQPANTFHSENKVLNKLKEHSLGSMSSPLVVDDSRMSTTLGVKGQLLPLILFWKFTDMGRIIFK